MNINYRGADLLAKILAIMLIDDLRNITAVSGILCGLRTFQLHLECCPCGLVITENLDLEVGSVVVLDLIHGPSKRNKD